MTAPQEKPGRLAYAALPALALLSLTPWATAAMGLVAGVALALTLGNPYQARTRRLTHPLLSLSLVGLGAGMDLRVILAAGARGIGYTAAGIGACLLAGHLLSRALRVPRVQALLVTVGTAICGGSAIAAVVPILRPKEHEVSVALGTVFLLNSAGLLIFPPLGHALSLSQEQFGLWAALAIHDTSSVVGAGAVYGAQALAVATTVKLARALWIIPLALAFGAWVQRGGGAAGESKPRRPWFILGFLAAAALVTLVPALRPAGHLVARVARQALVLTLLLIGSNLSRDALRAVGPRPLLHGVLLWVIMGGLSLGGIYLQLIR
jgi:uncharacterized integral membrane protein (TIGR00698 family)